MRRTPKVGPVSRALHTIGDLTSKATASAVVIALVAAFLVALAVAGFPAEWEGAFATVAGAITLVMVFVIQHTQSRQQRATQLKLDELVRTSPHADDLLVHVEAADDEELIAIERDQVGHHTAIREG